jgi:hypothetical protein
MTKIIIIDDDDTIRMSLKDILTEKGFSDIIEADTGESGLELIDNNNVDCVLLDLHMPGIDGFEVCKRLRANEKTKNIPIILLTARFKDSESIVKGFEAGANDFLTKPYNIVELLARIKSALKSKRKTEQLKNERDLSKNLVEDANAIVLVLDRSYNIINVNKKAENILGLTRNELFNKNFFEHLYEDEQYRNNVSSTYLLVRESQKEFYELETNILNANNEKILIRWSITFRYDENYRLKRIINIGHDVTETSRLQNTIELLAADLKIKNLELDQKNIELSAKNEQLTELNKLKDDILHIASHDLRSPLNGILGYTQLLLSQHSEEYLLSEKQTTVLQKVKYCGEVQLTLINDLLDIAKLESGKLELRLSKVNLVDVISSCIELLESLAMNKDIKLNFRKNINLIWVTIDVPKITQVINNLINNAIKFTPSDGNIDISVFAKDNLIEVSIKDTGVGIEKKDLSKVFKKFSQIRKHGTSGEKGTGLGLAICNNLVKLHGGIISVFSEGLNKGSTFLFTLPYK